MSSATGSETPTPLNEDRTVHAQAGEWQIVRYDRAGQWYIEYDPPRLRSARHIKIREAAWLAVQMEHESAGHIFEGRKGGRIFDARVCELRDETADRLDIIARVNAALADLNGELPTLPYVGAEQPPAAERTT